MDLFHGLLSAFLSAQCTWCHVGFGTAPMNATFQCIGGGVERGLERGSLDAYIPKGAR